MLPTEYLDDMLRRFFAEVRTTEGKMYSRSTYSGIRAALNRHIRSPPFSRNISLTYKEFHKSCQVFQATLKKLSTEGLDTTTHHQAISEGDLTKLRSSDTFNEMNAYALQKKVWFEISLAFARRGCENIQDLKKDAYVFRTDDTGREYVEMAFNEKLKNHQGIDMTKNMDSKPRMYASKSGSMSCPVKALKFYLSKLNSEGDRLFQQPKQKFKIENPVWYTTRPVGQKTISAFMSKLSTEAGLSRRYTNHCVRATTVTLLSHAGVTNRAITRITKHRNEKSLEYYETDSSDEQKRSYSDILLQENNDNPEAEAPTVSHTAPVSADNRPTQLQCDTAVSVPNFQFEQAFPVNNTAVSVSSSNSTSVTNVLNQRQTPQYMNPFHFSGCNVRIDNHFHYH